MHIDILTRDDLPYTFENFAAKRLQAQLHTLGVRCRHITDLGPYLYEVRASPPDWTLAFEDLLGWETPLCDILGQHHFHWERRSLQGLDHLLKSPHCEIGFHQKIEGIHHLSLPIEQRPPLKKIFDLIGFFGLTEETQELVESFDRPLHLFGEHKGKNWLVRLKNSHHVHLHMPLPFQEQLRALQMANQVIMDEDDPLYLWAYACGCEPLSRGLTKIDWEAHSWQRKTQELLNCLFPS